MNIPCLKLRSKSLHLTHLQKLRNNHNNEWPNAEYLIGIPLRKYNPSFASNRLTHIPIFYKTCLSSFYKFTDINPDVSFSTINNKLFYKILLCDESGPPKIEKLCHNIDFKPVWQHINSSNNDPDCQNISWRLCHDVVYVNYYLYEKIFQKTKF